MLAVPCLASFGVLRTMVDRLTVRGALLAEELLLLIKPQQDAKPVAAPAAHDPSGSGDASAGHADAAERHSQGADARPASPDLMRRSLTRWLSYSNRSQPVSCRGPESARSGTRLVMKIMPACRSKSEI